MEIGNYTIEVPESLPVSLVVYDDLKTGDTFAWRIRGDTFPFPDTVSEINFLGFSLQTTDTSVLSSDALPLGDFDIADFPNLKPEALRHHRLPRQRTQRLDLHAQRHPSDSRDHLHGPGA